MKIKRILLSVALGLPLVFNTQIAVSKGRTTTFLMDAQTIAWLEDIAHPLLRTADLPIAETNIYLIKDSDVNAFVTAKNDIFVNTGLIERAEKPSEVQGVLAHEIAHIKARHVSQRLSKQGEMSVPTIIGAVLGVGAAALGNAQAANALLITGTAASRANTLKYSREHERQADDIAADLLNKNQISAIGLYSFFEKLRGDQLLYSSTPPKYLLTHPLPVERLDAVKYHIDNNEDKIEDLTFGDMNEFNVIKAKLLAFSEEGNRVRMRYAFREDEAANLANIIVLALEGKINDALELLEKNPQPYNPFYHELKAQLLLDLSKFNEALASFKQAVELRPTSSLLKIQYANTLTLAGKYKMAIEELLQLRQKHITWTSIHRDLAIAYGKLDKLTLSHLSLSEEAYLLKNPKDIKRHLQIAEAHLDKASELAKKRYTRIKTELLPEEER